MAYYDFRDGFVFEGEMVSLSVDSEEEEVIHDLHQIEAKDMDMLTLGEIGNLALVKFMEWPKLGEGERLVQPGEGRRFQINARVSWSVDVDWFGDQGPEGYGYPTSPSFVFYHNGEDEEGRMAEDPVTLTRMNERTDGHED